MENSVKNYLYDVMNIENEKNFEYKTCKPEQCKKWEKCCRRGKINEMCYSDPDRVGKHLYDDMEIYYKNVFYNTELKACGTKNQWYLKYDDIYIHELSIDYIGPSRKDAYRYLDKEEIIKDEIIRDFLFVSRTIGGHVFWPAHRIDKRNTINQIKGAPGVYDRIDIVLAELQNVCKNNFEDGEALYSKSLYQAFQRYKFFFEMFNNLDLSNDLFTAYIIKMQMCDFLNQGNVISLADSNLELEDIRLLKPELPSKPLDYELYIKNCKILIQKRTDRILGKD